METGSISAADGRALAASFFDARAPIASAVIGSATGVPRRFYEPFAAFLADAGISAVAFDYRGIGDSRRGPLRGDPSSMHDWGELDLDAALIAMESRVPGVARLYVGHSVGAQVIALARASERLDAALFVAGQSGYWRTWPFPRNLLMGSLWHATIPLVSGLLGFLPMRPAGGEDLPKGVAREWARWGRDPRYVLAHPGAEAALARLTIPIRDYAMRDDHYAPRAAIERLLACYRGAQTEIRDVDTRPIGHFGFFRERHRDTLWREAREWLLSRGSGTLSRGPPAERSLRS